MYRRSTTDSKITVVGVTGGTAAGKSTVCDFMNGRETVIIDADRIGHELLSENAYIKRSIYELFGDIILDQDRNIDRNRLGNLAFSDENSLEKLNGIVHPLLLVKLRDQITRAKKNMKRGVILVDAALIVDWNITSLFDYIVMVDALKQHRMKRLIKGKTLAPKQARDRINAQFPTSIKKQYVHYTIKNNGTLRKLKSDAQKVIKAIKSKKLKVKPAKS